MAGEIGEAVREGAGAATRSLWHEQEMPFPDRVRFTVDCDDARSRDANDENIDLRVDMFINSLSFGKGQQVDLEIVAGAGPGSSLAIGGARDRREIHHRRAPG